MNEDKLTIIGALIHKNLLTESLAHDAISMLKASQSPVQFIEKITKESKTEDCLHCNGEPFCQFLFALAYLELGALTIARSYIDNAVDGFHLRGMNWNRGIAYWLQGGILFQEGNKDAAKHSLTKALEILNSLLEELHQESKYQQAEKCQKYIDKIKKAIKSMGKLADVGSKNASTDKTTSDSKLSSAENDFYIAIPWIPVYQNIEVEAGFNGAIRTDQGIREKSELSTTYIDGKRYLIKPVRKGDTRISLSADKTYAWVKVHGHSMNNAQPTAIEEGDYVLFYQSGWPNNNEIVLAARTDHSLVEDGCSYIVKSYLKAEQELKSQTTQRGEKYDSVKITENYLCLGVVIAVAKPT